MKRHPIASVVLAALLAGAGIASAQGTITPAQTDPAKGGQASTKKSMGNTANPTQVPDGSAPASREAVKAEARAHNKNNANNMVPKGEATTTMNNQPNATPQPSGQMSRMEVSQAARKSKPQFGQQGERPDVVTNPMDKTGTPK